MYRADGKVARLARTGDPLPNPQPGTRMSVELVALLEAEGWLWVGITCENCKKVLTVKFHTITIIFVFP